MRGSLGIRRCLCGGPTRRLQTIAIVVDEACVAGMQRNQILPHEGVFSFRWEIVALEGLEEEMVTVGNWYFGRSGVVAGWCDALEVFSILGSGQGRIESERTHERFLGCSCCFHFSPFAWVVIDALRGF